MSLMTLWYDLIEQDAVADAGRKMTSDLLRSCYQIINFIGNSCIFILRHQRSLLTITTQIRAQCYQDPRRISTNQSNELSMKYRQLKEKETSPHIRNGLRSNSQMNVNHFGKMFISRRITWIMPFQLFIKCCWYSENVTRNVPYCSEYGLFEILATHTRPWIGCLSRRFSTESQCLIRYIVHQSYPICRQAHQICHKIGPNPHLKIWKWRFSIVTLADT